MRMIATGHPAERLPGLDRHLAVGLRRQIEDDLSGIDIGLDPWPSLGRPAVVDAVAQIAQAFSLLRRVPADALAAIAELVGERSECRESAISVGIVALDNGNLWGRDARNEAAFSLLPVLDLKGLGDF